MSLFATFNTAKQALLLNQTAIGVVSSNISNMNTEGYSKQRVLSEATGNLTIAGVNQRYQISAGADISDVQRYREEYLDDEYRRQNAGNSYYEELYSLASQIEGCLNEQSGSGLGTAISDFFTATSTLNSTPADSTARVNFVQKAQILCSQLNQIAQTFASTRTSIVGDVSDANSIYDSTLYQNLQGVNDKLEELANLNETIIKSSLTNSVPSSLLDKRDQLLDDISQYMPFTIEENSNNSINLYLNGQTIVQGNKFNHFDVALGTADNPSTIQVLNENNDVINSNSNALFTSGKIAAYLEMGGNSSSTLSFQSVLDKLNDLAGEIASQFNAVQTYDDGTEQALAIDFDADGNQILSDYSADGGLPDLFTTKTGLGTVSALNISVNSDILENYWKISAARIDTSGSWDNKSTGNAENIAEMSALRDKSSSNIDNMTFEGYLTRVVSNMGSDVESIEFNQEAQATLYDSADSTRQSAIGVNLDEELVDLVKYQRAYQASARIFTVASEIMEQLVNLGR